MPDPHDPFSAVSRAADWQMVYIEEAHATDEIDGAYKYGHGDDSSLFLKAF